MKSGWRASSFSCTRAVEKRETFEQPLDVRIGALEPVDAEASGDARIALRELRAHLAHELQLAVVVLEQPRIHGYAQLLGVGDADTSPESRSMLVRSTMCCGTGWPHSSASTWKAST